MSRRRNLHTRAAAQRGKALDEFRAFENIQPRGKRVPPAGGLSKRPVRAGRRVRKHS